MQGERVKDGETYTQTNQERERERAYLVEEHRHGQDDGRFDDLQTLEDLFSTRDKSHGRARVDHGVELIGEAEDVGPGQEGQGDVTREVTTQQELAVCDDRTDVAMGKFHTFW
jgi:hypothetical protein